MCVCERERACLCVSRPLMDEEGTRLSPNPHPPNKVYRCLFVIAISGPELSPQDQAPLYLCLTKQDDTTKTTQNIIQPLNPLFFAVIIQCHKCGVSEKAECKICKLLFSLNHVVCRALIVHNISLSLASTCPYSDIYFRY